MFEVITISFAFFFGLAVRQIGLPPLVGFLAAGFAINIFGPPLGLPAGVETIHRTGLEQRTFAGDRTVVLVNRAGRKTAGNQARAGRLSRSHRHRHPDRARHYRAGGAGGLVGPDTEYLGATGFYFAATSPGTASVAGFRRP